MLALDPADSCGVCIAITKGYPTPLITPAVALVSVRTGVWDVSASPVADLRLAASSDRPAKLLAALNGIADQGEPPIALLLVEQVTFGLNTLATMAMGEKLGIIRLFAQQRGIPMMGYGVQTVKKHGAGRGGSDKEAVAGGVRRRFPQLQHVPTGDQTDAAAVLACWIDGADPVGYTTNRKKLATRERVRRLRAKRKAQKAQPF